MSRADQRAAERWAAEFFAVVDARNPEGVAAYMTEDVRLQFANFPEQTGREFVRQAFADAAARFPSIRHEITGVWTGQWTGDESETTDGGQVISVELRVIYTLPDGRTLNLPATSTFRMRDGRVADYRIFTDPGPAFGASWIEPAGDKVSD